MPKRRKQRSRRLVENPAICVIETEGVEYILDWREFPRFGFVFIRCLDTAAVTQKLKASALRNRIGLHIVVGMRNNYWGIGVWRIR